MKPLFVITGIVSEGKKRGRNLGFPTANVPLSHPIPSGIYVSFIKIDTKTYQALTFIGEAKTFDETLFQAETYILDFSGDIYNQEVTIQLLKKLRENQKFSSVETLIHQMKEDEKEARIFLSNH